MDRLDISQISAQHYPPVAAVYQVLFDQRVGYTIAWKRCLDDLSLDGLDFKTLPSGLHNVHTDLVYFLHDAYVGASVFLQEVAGAEAHNAAFVALGVLVPQSYGKLGRSWLYAEKLRQLAEAVVSNPSNIEPLERFWLEHRLDGAETLGQIPSTDRPRSESPRSKKRNRARSDATTAVQPSLTADHPALSTSVLLDTCGPLIFPLFRAALMRKRILLVGSPPVQQNCNYVYDLSVLSSTPQKLSEILDEDADSLFRIKPLFSIGIHDMSSLEKRKSAPGVKGDPSEGWLACTTDDILAEKKHLYDLVVELKSTQVAPGSGGRWPRLRTSDGKVVKATQRDFRRFQSLSRELRRMRRKRRRAGNYTDNEDDDEVNGDDDDDRNPLLRSMTILMEPDDDFDPVHNDSSIIESQSWTTMAYTSFMWWASAGEKDAIFADEAAADQALLSDLPTIEEAMGRPETPTAHRRSNSGHSDSHERDVAEELHELQNVATVIVAYFHRLTTLIIEVMAGIVEEADDETEEGIEEDDIVISSADMQRMGLDADSEVDKEFVREVMQLYFGRQAAVAEGGVWMCGLRVC